MQEVDSLDVASGASGNKNVHTFATPGCYLGEGDSLIYVWHGATPGSFGRLNAEVTMKAGR
jgi:hypothetical protein